MIVGHGIDAIEIERIEDVIERYGQRFLDRIFTKEEQFHSDVASPVSRAERYAALWASKEATMKAIGTGNTHGVSFHDIEILHEKSGRPYIVLHGHAREHADALGMVHSIVSMTHTRSDAYASVIFEGK
jgi:holo-[acyl-carrier protein] synthase